MDFQAEQEWERRVSLELYQEYAWIIRSQKLALRPAVVTLKDLETHWGQWDSLTRTISISRKLIHNYSWFHVVGIFRHEIAHQLVDETYPFGIPQAKSHGEVFKWACKKVGVPEEFSGASVRLQEQSPDWREWKRDEVTDRLLDKVRKLLALATSSNEHEALSAKNKVRELYAKHNLEQTAQDTRSRFSHLVICHGKKRIEIHQDKILGILVGHFFVQVVYFRLYDAKSGERHKAVEIIGTRENVLMAEYVYHFLLRQLEFLVREVAKHSPKKLTRVERKSYALGILEGFAEKLAHSEVTAATVEENHRTASSELSLIGKALVRFRRDPGFEQYLAEVHPRLGSRSPSCHLMDDFAFDAGRSVGKTITLNKAVTAAEGNMGRLLERKA